MVAVPVYAQVQSRLRQSTGQSPAAASTAQSECASVGPGMTESEVGRIVAVLVREIAERGALAEARKRKDERRSDQRTNGCIEVAPPSSATCFAVPALFLLHE